MPRRYWQTLIKLRLPRQLPFVFNGLKICSTLALIGAIVAEFFGTPTVGMGFRISTEVGRMNLDMVWAEIVGRGPGRVRPFMAGGLITLYLLEKQRTLNRSGIRGVQSKGS